MALAASTSMAAVGGLESKIQKSTLWSSSQLSRPFSPVLVQPSIKKVTRRGQKNTSICAISINRPASMAGAPKSPGKDAAEKVVPAEAPTSINKGWSNAMDVPDQLLVGQLRTLATVALDRSEMHQIVSVQRDNWNSLFHTTITMAAVSSAIAAAVNGAEHALGLSIVASGLGLGVAALMALVNFLQPSQLAEQQRSAARFFKRLATDIESTLEIDPRLRQGSSDYLEQKLATLHALDSAFPMPLGPIVHEIFPKMVSPSILSGPPVDLAAPQERTSSQSANGWTPAMEKDLKRTSQLLQASDIPGYVKLATGVNHLNKILAIASTVMASSGALCNMVDIMPGMHISVIGAALTVGASFVYSLSSAVQLGAAYETYRTCGGYYVDLVRSIETTLITPVEQRENGTLFVEKISLQLGRSPAELPMVPLGQKRAGTLF